MIRIIYFDTSGKVVIMTLWYLAFVRVASLNDIGGLYILRRIIGASPSSCIPIILEFLVETSPLVGPEVTTTSGWAGCYLPADAMNAGANRMPSGNTSTYPILQAAPAIAVPPAISCRQEFIAASRGVRISCQHLLI